MSISHEGNIRIEAWHSNGRIYIIQEKLNKMCANISPKVNWIFQVWYKRILEALVRVSCYLTWTRFIFAHKERRVWKMWSTWCLRWFALILTWFFKTSATLSSSQRVELCHHELAIWEIDLLAWCGSDQDKAAVDISVYALLLIAK